MKVIPIKNEIDGSLGPFFFGSLINKTFQSLFLDGDWVIEEVIWNNISRLIAEFLILFLILPECFNFRFFYIFLHFLEILIVKVVIDNLPLSFLQVSTKFFPLAVLIVSL